MTIRRALLFAPGPIIAAALGAISVPLVAWIFSAADVGRMNVLQIMMNIALVSVFLGLDQSYVREYHETHDSARRLLYSTSMLPPIIIFGVIAIPVSLYPAEVAGLLYAQSDPRLTFATLACVAAAIAVREWTLIVRMEDRGGIFSVAQVVPRLVMICAVLVVHWLALRADFFVLAVIVVVSTGSALIPLGIATRRVWLGSGIRVDMHLLRGLLRYGMPMAAATLAYVLLTSMGSIALRALSSLEELGVYAVAVSVAGVAALVQSIFSVIWAPALYKAASVGERESRQIVVSVLDACVGVVGLCFALVGMMSWCLEFVLPAGYGAVRYLVVGAVAQPLFYTLGEVTGAGIGIRRRTSLGLVVAVASVSAGFASAWLLVPAFGASGATFATVLSLAILLIGRTEVASSIWFPLPRRGLYMMVALTVVGIVLSLTLGPSTVFALPVVWGGYGAVSLFISRRWWRGLLRNISVANGQRL